MFEFTRPVTLLVGLGFPSIIRNVPRAYATLVDWPESQRGPAHAAALSACREALSGQVDCETARSAFIDFARQAGVIVNEPFRGPMQSAAGSTRGDATRR